MLLLDEEETVFPIFRQTPIGFHGARSKRHGPSRSMNKNRVPTRERRNREENYPFMRADNTVAQSTIRQRWIEVKDLGSLLSTRGDYLSIGSIG